MNWLWITYAIGACLMFTALIVLCVATGEFKTTTNVWGLPENGHRVGKVACLLIASALWPATLTIQAGMVCFMIYEMRYWPK